LVGLSGNWIEPVPKGGGIDLTTLYAGNLISCVVYARE
jgi:hypothetical protein